MREFTPPGREGFYVSWLYSSTSLCNALGVADREACYGDPRFVDVPIDTLMSAAYSAERRKAIDPNRAFPGMPAPGNARGEHGRHSRVRPDRCV